MFVLSFLINFSVLSLVRTQSGSIFINRPILQDTSETWYNSPTMGHVRCFCNLPSCVSTGYICKSTSGGCFSNLLHQPPPTYTVYKGLHGCLELLTDKEQRDWCKANPNSPIGRKKKHHPRSLLYCCYSDMCNHVDNPETTNLMDESVSSFNESENSKLEKNSSSHQINALTYSNAEVWFKAATIAVPICGAVIVLVLVVLAIRLLRTDSASHTRHKLGSPYIPTQNKNNCDKYGEHYKKSHRHHDIHKESIPTHHNPVYFNHHVEELQQIRTPLLVQNELGHSNNVNKNTNTSTKYIPSCRPFDTSSVDATENLHYFNIPNSSPELMGASHQNNLFCDVAVSNSFAKCIIYDKANLRNEYDDSDINNDMLGGKKLNQ